MAQHSQNNWVGLQHEGFSPPPCKTMPLFDVSSAEMSVQLCFIQTAALGMLFFLSKQIVCIDSKASGSSLCFGALAHVLLTKTPPGCLTARCHVRSGKISRFACFLTCFHQSGASAAGTSFLLVYTPSFLPHYSSFYWADCCDEWVSSWSFIKI